MTVALLRVFTAAALMTVSGMQVHAAGGPPTVAEFEGMPVTVASTNGAGNLVAQTECTGDYPRRGIAKLQWSVAQPRGAEQRVLVSIYGFRDGRFESTPALPPDQTAYTWDRIHGQAIHSWIVLTRQGNTWVASTREAFEVPTCVADLRTGAMR